MEKHWHLSAESLILGALGVAVTFHVMRFIAGKLVNASGPAGEAGKALGAVFSFPAQ